MVNLHGCDYAFALCFAGHHGEEFLLRPHRRPHLGTGERRHPPAGDSAHPAGQYSDARAFYARRERPDALAGLVNRQRI